MRRPRRGFTLVELLVVIGIIAIMISVLLPTLAGARSRAASVQCLSNLRQQGQAMVMYANQNKGWLPGTLGTTIYRFPREQAAAVSRNLKGDTKIYYCPTNELLPPGSTIQILPEDFNPEDHGGTWDQRGSGTSGRILYWWVANPGAADYNGVLNRTGIGDAEPRFPPAGVGPVYRDVDLDGTIRDEYMRKMGEKNSTNIVVSTDWSGQLNSGRGWFFIHGKQAWLQPSFTPADAKRLNRSWKNNLYGDGHAEQKRPDEVVYRWGPAGPACW